MTIPLDQLTDAIAVESLASTTCPHCGQSKKRGMSFCFRGHWDLTQRMRCFLWQPIGQGYREAVIEAMNYLGAGVVRLAAPGPPQHSGGRGRSRKRIGTRVGCAPRTTLPPSSTSPWTS